MEFPIEKPATPEELAHHGVKGMKWGVRNRKFKAEFNRANPTRRQKNRAIVDARRRVATRRGSISRKDQAIAARLTTGEKAVAGILVVSGVGILPVAAFVGINAANRRSLERMA